MKIKKLLSFLLIALLFIGSPSCSSDDPIEEQIEQPGGDTEEPGDKEDPEDPKDPEEPEEPEQPEEPGIDENDPDFLAYGKEFKMGDVVYPIENFEKETIEKGIDRMSISIYQTSNPKFRLRAHVLRFDRELFKKGYSLESFMGGKTLVDYATPLAIAQRENDESKELMATINADFFDMGNHGPILGTMIMGHNVVKIGSGGWKKVYGATTDNEIFIDELTFDMKLDNAKINNINSARGADELILYTQEKGEKTGANEWGTEILLKPVNGEWGKLDNYSKISCEVVAAPEAVKGGIAIPEGHVVLSGNGKAAEVCSKYKKGDKVTIQIVANGKDGKEYTNIKTAVGTPFPILLNGEVVAAEFDAGNPTGREPRTAIGHSDKFVYMVAVEARNRKSFGFSTIELGEFMKFIDATDAVNLDGGGSTLLVTGNGNKTFGQGDGQTYFRSVPNVISIVKYKK